MKWDKEKNKCIYIEPHHPIFHSGHKALQWQKLVCRSLLALWDPQGNPAWSDPPLQGPPHTGQAPYLLQPQERYTSIPSPAQYEKHRTRGFHWYEWSCYCRWNMLKFLGSSRQCYLFIPHIIGAGGSRFLHCHQTEHLEEMVLHDISIRRTELASGSPATSTLYAEVQHLALYAVSHRIIPKSSKYPPRPWVPKGSLKVRTTQATLFLFHIGPKIRFPNLNVRA